MRAEAFQQIDQKMPSPPLRRYTVSSSNQKHFRQNRASAGDYVLLYLRLL